MKVKDFCNRMNTWLFPNTYASLWQKRYSAYWHWPEGFVFEINGIFMVECILVKGTHISDDFRQMLPYFVQFQSITDNQAVSKSFSASWVLGNRKQYKYIPVAMDKLVVLLPPFRAVKLILTVFLERHNQTLKDLCWLFGTLPSSPNPPIHGGIVSISQE